MPTVMDEYGHSNASRLVTPINANVPVSNNGKLRLFYNIFVYARAFYTCACLKDIKFKCRVFYISVNNFSIRINHKMCSFEHALINARITKRTRKHMSHTKLTSRTHTQTHTHAFCSSCMYIVCLLFV